MNEEQKIKLAEALNYARQNTQQPNWLMRQINKAHVINILNEEKEHMEEVSDAVKGYNKYLKKSGDGGYNGTKLDDFYHKRGMYRAAQLGPDAAEYALWLGRQKEKYLDKPLKYITTSLTKEQIDADSKKDLQNNVSAVIMSLNNPGMPVNKVIPHQGTTAGVFDKRFRQ